MFGVCMRLFCVYVVLCLDSGLATGYSLVQGVLPSVKNYYGTESEAWALNGLEEPLKKMQVMEMSLFIAQVVRCWPVTDELALEQVTLRASSVFPHPIAKYVLLRHL
jgi:hypothetical protein